MLLCIKSVFISLISWWRNQYHTLFEHGLLYLDIQQWINSLFKNSKM